MIYCDYNASTPLSEKLRGVFFDLPFANPSSQHKLGKEALKIIHESERVLLSTFGIENSHFCLFHSGATEGANFFIQGIAKKIVEAKKTPYFLYSKTDHSCIVEQVASLKLLGVECLGLSPNENMDFPRREFIKQIDSILKNSENELIFNYTWVHNESGVVWELDELVKLKLKYENRMAIHVDATQSVGKISHFRELSKVIDCYTYSGHKFGALKGVGWSFLSQQYKSKTPIEPLIVGGGQQYWLRSGTLNTHGIYSLACAIQELNEKFDPVKLKENITYLRNEITKLIKNYGEIFPASNENINLNTIFMYFYDVRSQLLIPAFDMAGIALGSGSACSSGTFIESRLLQTVGLNDFSKNSLRISVSPFITKSECEEILKIYKKVLKQVTKEIDF